MCHDRFDDVTDGFGEENWPRHIVRLIPIHPYVGAVYSSYPGDILVPLIFAD